MFGQTACSLIFRITHAQRHGWRRLSTIGWIGQQMCRYRHLRHGVLWKIFNENTTHTSFVASEEIQIHHEVLFTTPADLVQKQKMLI